MVDFFQRNRLMKKILLFTFTSVVVAVLAAGCVRDLGYYYLSGVSSDSEMGSVQGSGTYYAGTTVALQAIPAEGCYFVGWVEGEDAADQGQIEDIITQWNNPCEVTVNSNVTYTAIFRRWGDAECSVQFGESRWDAIDMMVSLTGEKLHIQAFSKSSAVNSSQYNPLVYPIIHSLSFKTVAHGVCHLGKDDLHVGEWPRLFYYQNKYIDGTEVHNFKAYRPYGDWWAKSAKVVLYGVDWEQHRVSLSIEAEMYDAVAVMENGLAVENAATRKLTVQMNNVSLSDYW